MEIFFIIFEEELRANNELDPLFWVNIKKTRNTAFK